MQRDKNVPVGTVLFDSCANGERSEFLEHEEECKNAKGKKLLMHERMEFLKHIHEISVKDRTCETAGAIFLFASGLIYVTKWKFVKKPCPLFLSRFVIFIEG